MLKLLISPQHHVSRYVVPVPNQSQSQDGAVYATLSQIAAHALVANETYELNAAVAPPTAPYYDDVMPISKA